MTEKQAAQVERSIQAYSRAYEIFCTKQLGAQTEAAEERMERIYSRVEAAGLTEEFDKIWFSKAVSF